MTKYLSGKVILITGATGSFGSNCVKYLLKNYSPKKIIVFSRDELKQSELQNEIRSKKVRFFIGDIRDRYRLSMAMSNVDIVIHAAALKQVPAAEYNPYECIQTNIIGAENVIFAAIENNVKKVIALSTDKASIPINLYGATKLVSDKLFIAANNLVGEKKIRFSVVRYGNVIGSRGSIIPYFFQLLKDKSAFLPITHKDMTRFWITIDEGIKFVLDSLNLMKGGEIFIPKMNSVKIVDVAKAIYPKAKIKIIGIRPGEKLHESMWSIDETRSIIEFKKYYIISPEIKFFDLKSSYSLSYEKEKGKFINKEFVYSSINNSNFLNINQIKSILNK